VRFLLLLVGCLPGLVAGEISFVPQNSGVSASLRGLSVVSDRVAWASGTGGTVLRTTDGGTSWQKLAVPGAESLDFRDIEAFSARNAFALSSGPGEKSRLYRTIDGGASWQLVKTNPDPKGFWDAIAFADPSHGVLMGDPVDGRFVIETTSDAGANWQRREPPASLPGEGGFAASGTCLVRRGNREIWFATGAARVFRSADGGATWTVHETPLRQAEASAGIFSLALGPGKSVLAVGGDFKKPEESGRTLARSLDGGRTWTSGAGLRGYRSGVAYFGGNVVVAVGTSGADVSEDGGMNWRAVEAVGYNAVQRGWAVGPAGRIARVTVR
jgi:photosystem II stability/assembly factor-like uncharacterized protein